MALRRIVLNSTQSCRRKTLRSHIQDLTVRHNPQGWYLSRGLNHHGRSNGLYLYVGPNLPIS
ncbi:hypothetical protein COMA2_90158 [Candidatus Nitrospira nitrificans]|uniref:Uncharacterized protein n=1 Tax=Candidatus Nitrospira nitrificans TaxID=1742973 RepID=A0A0S4LVK5_9BACT|nr:hypothetical protein COMA2_90158 [Candidatus Nitrospira nitrificans]